MAQQPSGAPPKLSLYEELVETSNPNASISAAPVMYNTKEDDLQAKIRQIQMNLNTARPQPKRPSQNAVKGNFRPKIATSSSKVSSPSTVARTSSPDKTVSGSSTANLGSSEPARSGIDAWVGGDDDYWEGPRRDRGNRKRRKKEKDRKAKEDRDWDAIYDPSRPTNYEAYKDSDERIREIEDWMAVLRGNRGRRRSSSGMQYSDNARSTPQTSARPGLSFAPPSMYDPLTDPAIPPPASVPEDAIGDDAYARRLHSSGMPPSQNSSTPPYVSQSTPTVPPPPPPPPPPAPPRFAPGVVLEAAPVRYELPPPPPDLPTDDLEMEGSLEDTRPTEELNLPQPSDKRPGKKGFAQRYMESMGYKKGDGLGAHGTGIISALSVQKQKPVKTYDEEGRVGLGRSDMGKIVGGKKKAGTEDATLSTIVRCLHMVDGRDLDHDMGPDGNLVEEIGIGCGEKYGNIERVLIHRAAKGPTVPVFLKFTNTVSALRAVAALDGNKYGENVVKADYWDEDKYHRGIYE